MPKETTRPGFRFQKVAAWGPPIILLFALLLIFMGEVIIGVLAAVAGLLFWFLVRRRGASQAPAANPSAEANPPTGDSR